MQDNFLKNLSFLDVEKGLSYCGDSAEFYREMLEAFLENSSLPKLQQAYETGDADTYRIDIHALKSSSLMLGATAFSEDCRLLEQAAKEKDLSYIDDKHVKVMGRYRQLMTAISHALGCPDNIEQGGVIRPSSQADMGVPPDILVVDDDPINQRLAQRILEQDMTIACVSSGQEALEYLRQKHPRLILLDLHMPDMSGFQVMEQLKKDSWLKEIPVVFLTADQDTEAEVEGFTLGAMDFIRKPFIREIMLQRVRRILELEQLKNHLQQEVDRQMRTARERKRQLERLTHQVIQALAGTVDAKDRYTNGHSMRVAKYSKEIAMRMGLSQEYQENIYYTGMLHDIGKIGVPDWIINKTGRLTDEEFDIIKTHPVIGSEILKNITEIPGLYLGTRGHHERYDGRGYPDGLKGEEIPLLARIIAVADSYDAMTSHRSYRKLLPQEVVRREIEEGKGTQFDPAIADIMLTMIDADIDYTMHE